MERIKSGHREQLRISHTPVNDRDRSRHASQGRLERVASCVFIGMFGILVPACSSSSEQLSGAQGWVRTVVSHRASAQGVQGARLEYVPVDCDSGLVREDLESIRVELTPERLELDATIPGVQDLPSELHGSHLFANHVQMLQEGCVDVISTPVNALGEPDSRCKPAKRSKVKVQAGDTAEVVLLNQCEGLDSAFLGVVVLLNEEPVIVNHNFGTSKFVSCAASQKVCVSAKDPNHNPMTLEWRQRGESPARLPVPLVVSRESSEDGTLTECVEFRPSAPGRYELSVEVFDLVNWGGELVKMQEVTEEGHVSSATLDLFFYAVPEGALEPPKEYDHPQRHGVLILENSVVGRHLSLEALAAQRVLGLDAESVHIVDDNAWASMTREDFARYNLIILGDPDCGAILSEHVGAAEKNQDVWGQAVDGNVLIYGSNPTTHNKLDIIEHIVAFAAAMPNRTGAYISTSCYFETAPENTPIPLLDSFGSFSGRRTAGCPNDVELVATHPQLWWTGEDLSDWGCSAHQFFERWPADFDPVAVALGFGGETVAPSGKPGQVFVLARGVSPLGCGNEALEPGEECDDGNVIGGDGCDEACRREICGNGRLDGLESCDDGNLLDGDGCDANCQTELGVCESHGEPWFAPGLTPR